MTDGDMERVVQKYVAGIVDRQPAVQREAVSLALDFVDMVTLHTSEHAGEIAALLAIRGLRGSPWGWPPRPSSPPGPVRRGFKSAAERNEGVAGGPTVAGCGYGTAVAKPIIWTCSKYACNPESACN
jgi:hypothetical protein